MTQTPRGKKIVLFSVIAAIVIGGGLFVFSNFYTPNGIVEVEAPKAGAEADTWNDAKGQKQTQALEELQQKIKVLLVLIQQQSIKSPETVSSRQIKNTCPIIAEDFKETNPKSNNNDEEIFKLLKERKKLFTPHYEIGLAMV